jgi:penicillin-binding protein 1A
VWVGHPDARATLGYNAFGGTLAAPIWHDYMEVAKGDYCGDFPEPQEPIDYQPFSGEYANGGGDYQSDYSSGSSSSSYTTPTTTTPTTGGYSGYDPQYYAPGAGQQPAPSPPDEAGGDEGGN